ncbi:DSHCT domain-containing protein [Ditylenchus destructor]|nr:DSHCT domain-containing protein [Ditylenchus destructor]
MSEEIKKEAEKCFRHLAVDYLTKNVPEYDISETYRIENTEADPLTLANNIGVIERYPSHLQPIFSPDTGEILAFEERWLENDENEGNAHTSMSIRRAPDAKSFSKLLGNSSNVPFLPGGFDEEVEKIFRFSNKAEAKDEEEGKFLDFSELLNIPPGFSGAVDVSEAMELKLPVLDLDSADIFDILDIVMNTSIEAVPELPKPSTIIRPDKIKSRPAEEKSETEPLLTVDDASTLEKAITSRVSQQKLPVQKKNLTKEKRPDNGITFAHLMDVTKKVEKFEKLLPNMAKKYPFDLDPFQQQAVVSMEEGSSVFVAAHTSAGKTVVAEYAIALCKIHRTRVIYTSPIKALSNQKFRDFKMIFDEVGLVTGDIQLNTDAFCLIMTTEILRSMLYNGSEVIRELEWVIFDEVHYINDAERGHVWEEVLIMLPAHVKIVMLSATVPNCLEFADWVGRIKNRNISVIQTLKRPVPLEHHLYTGQDGKTRKNLFKIMDKDGGFSDYQFKKASEAKKPPKSGTAKSPGAKRSGNFVGGNEKNVYINLIEHLKKRCDDTAQILKSIDLTTGKEKSEIHRFFTRCVERLKGTDRQLPQVLLMQELCMRGFACHHSGILPIIKEVVELLFQKGYVKILFATETFAMGVNMPARTVVFDTIEKFDGNQRRPLNPTEYTQMAGRAGRRGLDSTGTVIVLCKGSDMPDTLTLRNILMGKPISLESKFRITYQMILNLLRVEQLRIEDMLQRSFFERSSLLLMVGRKEDIHRLKDEIAELPPINCSICKPDSGASILSYFQTLRLYISEFPALWNELVKYDSAKLFVTGRVLIICHPPLGLAGKLAVVLNASFNEGGQFRMTLFIAVDENFQGRALQMTKEFESKTEEDRKWYRETIFAEYLAFHGIDGVARSSDSVHKSYYILEELTLDSVTAVCKQQIKSVDAVSIIKEFETQKRIYRKRSPDRMATRLITDLDSLTQKWTSPSCSVPVYVIGQDILRQTMNKIRLQETLQTLSYQTSTDGLLMSDEYKNRLSVLQASDYVDKNNMVDLKGKVACEINNQELLITELMLENKFNDLSCAEIAALLSPLSCQSGMGKRSNGNGYKKEDEVARAPADVIKKLRDDLSQVAQRIDKIQQQFRVAASISDELVYDLMEVAYQWASGVPFSDITKLTDAQEGIIVRCIQRLVEVCKDVRNAARIIGNPALIEKMEETSAAIKRDIVFAASLYTTE